MGVAMKITMMTGMVCIGLGQGVQPLLGYCVGAKNWERYRSALKFSLIFAFSLSTVLTLLCYLFTGQIVSVFLTDAVAYDYGVSFAHILLCTSFLFGIFYVLINALQARGAATESLIVNISRQGLIYIPAMFILGAIFHETGLIWAQPVADVLSLLLALLLYMRSSKRLPYSMTTPVFCPRCEWNFTVKLSHSNSPYHLESMEPSVPPRQARTLFGCVTENAFASE